MGIRPGYDYTDTFSPVVQLETIRAILALVLNGILQETVYMRQPEGFGDGSGKVCQLVKTLKSDPCAYIRTTNNDLEIITVWVDDLLLFTFMEMSMSNRRKINDLAKIIHPSNPEVRRNAGCKSRFHSTRP